jgi:hypothetical protein
MNLINILYEPYVIIIFISLVITGIAYYILINNKSKDEDTDHNNIPKNLLYTFLISFVLLIILKFGLEYMNKNNFFQKGGEITSSDRLTLMADDVDCDMLE